MDPKIIKIRREVYDHLDDLTRLAAEVLQQQGCLIIIDDEAAP